MAYQVTYEAEALKVLAKLPAKTRENIFRKMDLLAQNPDAPNANVKKLKGQKYDEIYRLRVADWRVFYRIHRDRIEVVVLDVSSRGSAYKH